MKIGLLSRYNEVARFAEERAPVHTPSDPEAFQGLIGSVVPNDEQPLAMLKKSSEGRMPASRPELVSQRERGAALEAPNLERLAPPGLVKVPESGVKTPSVIGGFRGGESREGQPLDTPEARAPRASLRRDDIAPLDKAPRQEVARLVATAGKRHGIDPALSMAVVGAESSFNADAVSSDGHASKGLMQLLDSTGKELLDRAGLTEEYSPFDPQQNIDLGVSYLRRLHDAFKVKTDLGNSYTTIPAANSTSLEKLAVAAFNAGEGRVAAAQGRAQAQGKVPGMYSDVEEYLPESTKEYVARVMQLRSEMSANFGFIDEEP